MGRASVGVDRGRIWASISYRVDWIWTSVLAQVALGTITDVTGEIVGPAALVIGGVITLTRASLRRGETPAGGSYALDERSSESRGRPPDGRFQGHGPHTRLHVRSGSRSSVENVRGSLVSSRCGVAIGWER
jgi:hypothetical protein